MPRSRSRLPACAARVLSALLGAAMAGCASPGADPPAARPSQVRALDLDAYPDPIDRDRVALARFVGAWDFSGWHNPPGEPQRVAKGIAAGTIDHVHFLLLDVAREVTQAGTAGFATGSMLLGAEPGVGLMLTAWSSESPSVHRFRGEVEAEGCRFVFNELRPVRGRDRLRLVIRFETDDRWVADFYRTAPGGEVLAASYTFTRAS